MRPPDRHGFTNPPGGAGFTIVNVAFPRETLDFLRTRYFPGAKTLFWADTPQPFQTTLNSSRLRWLQGWADQLARAPRTRLEIERFLLDLLADLMATTRTAGGPEWLRHALEEIREPQHFTGGTPALAKLAGRTPQHVNRALREHLGLTATDAVNEARLDYAAMQLRMSTQKIITIGLDCGFQNLGHFYQVFRRRFGTTPRFYRLRHQAVVPSQPL
jgi:AraC family cel operon transcriptional repressor